MGSCNEVAPSTLESYLGEEYNFALPFLSTPHSFPSLSGTALFSPVHPDLHTQPLRWWGLNTLCQRDGQISKQML